MLPTRLNVRLPPAFMSASNFSFLVSHSPLLAELGATAERLYPYDPASCVLKLRLLAESLTQEVADRIGLTVGQSTQAELLRAVDQRLGLVHGAQQLGLGALAHCEANTLCNFLCEAFGQQAQFENATGGVIGVEAFGSGAQLSQQR